MRISVGLTYEVKRALRRLGIDGMARVLRDRADPKRREIAIQNAALFAEEGERLAPIAAAIREACEHASKTGLIVSYDRAAFVLAQLPVMMGMAAAGIAPVPMLPSVAAKSSRKLFEACGIDRFTAWDIRADATGKAEVLRSLRDCTSQDDLLALTWRDIRVGKYAVSSLMRRLRQGHIDPQKPEIRDSIAILLEQTIDHTAAAFAMVEEWKPETVALVDRGYTPEGPLFDVCVDRGIEPITFNVAHRDNTLMLKRYRPENRDVHPSSLSAVTWERIKSAAWTDTHWEAVSGELEFCYRSGQWYSEVGTQFHTRQTDTEALRDRLGLDPGKRTVLLFPHIFWDATFFWGEDLFPDYEAWFRRCAEAAWADDSVNWVIKLHPANIIKNARDGIHGQFSENEVLAELGPVPNHVHILPADTDVPTIALFEIGDICLTVRGTVGIEAAAYGLLVITAGTGRYDGLGFTVDPKSTEEFDGILSRLDTLSLSSDKQVELARRFAYGLLLDRPLSISTILLSYDRDNHAEIVVRLHDSASAELLKNDDAMKVTSWLQSKALDFCVSEYDSAK